MAAANFSGTKAKIEEYESVRRMEERHVRVAPEGERAEIRQNFQAKGFKGEALDTVVDVITEKKDRWIETMMTEEHGLPPITRSPFRSALATFLAFIICGAIPLLPFVFGLPATIQASTLLTGLTFFSIGSLRSRWSPTPWWRAGVETFAIGMSAAAMAYIVGRLLSGLIA
jgi:VIT1/CCC1 family predicted Fe2+/Mn2+ transporter